MKLTLQVKPFSFHLTNGLQTSQGILAKKNGWLLRIGNSSGHCGWGEVSPIDNAELVLCEKLIARLKSETSHNELEDGIATWPSTLAFGVGAALAEVDGLIGSNKKKGWLSAPQSAILLPQNQSILKAIDCLVDEQKIHKHPLTLKWKIGIESRIKEEALLLRILERLPTNARLRLDANAGLDRLQASGWAKNFLKEPRLEWFEQPLAANDLEGLAELSKQIPVALDESLLLKPSLRKTWKGWQVRRPLLEGDPRILLKELTNGIGLRMLSTTFETGIGLRWVHHLAALQQQGPTPTAPGLAPGWCPTGPLFSSDPDLVWKAA